MDAQQLTVRVRDRGWRIVDIAVNRSGQVVYSVKLDSPGIAAMFHNDLADLVMRRATLEQIAARNNGADLANPWPVC